MKGKDSGAGPSRARGGHTTYHPPFAEMVKEALKNHSGDGGLTADHISEHIKAMNYSLVPGHDNIFPHLLDLLVQQNIIACNESGLYTLITDQPDVSVPKNPVGTASPADKDASEKAIVLLPMDRKMVKDVLIYHRGIGLTGEAIRERIEAGGSDLPPEEVQLHLDMLVQKKEVTRNQSGLYALARSRSAGQQPVGPSSTDKNVVKKATTPPSYSWMVRDVLSCHGGNEGLTAEAIDVHLKAGNYNLPAEHDDIFQDQLNLLMQKNVIVFGDSALYTISEHLDVRKLKPPVGPGRRIDRALADRSWTKVSDLMRRRGMTTYLREKQQPDPGKTDVTGPSQSGPTSSSAAQGLASHRGSDDDEGDKDQSEKQQPDPGKTDVIGPSQSGLTSNSAGQGSTSHSGSDDDGGDKDQSEEQQPDPGKTDVIGPSQSGPTSHSAGQGSTSHSGSDDDEGDKDQSEKQQPDTGKTDVIGPSQSGPTSNSAGQGSRSHSGSDDDEGDKDQSEMQQPGPGKTDVIGPSESGLTLNSAAQGSTSHRGSDDDEGDKDQSEPERQA